MNLHLMNKDELNQELRVLKKRIQQHHEKQEGVKGQKEKKGFRHRAKTPITTGSFTLDSPEPEIKIQSLV